MICIAFNVISMNSVLLLAIFADEEDSYICYVQENNSLKFAHLTASSIRICVEHFMSLKIVVFDELELLRSSMIRRLHLKFPNVRFIVVDCTFPNNEGAELRDLDYVDIEDEDG